MPDLELELYDNKILEMPLPSSGFSGGVYLVSTFYTDINQFNRQLIPIEANVRKPQDNTVATAAMKQTIADQDLQTRFWAYNGGLVIIARNCTKRGNKVILNLPPGYGLLNGGHTQLAIKNALRHSAATDTLVRVEVMSGEFTPDEIAAVAEARNTSKNVKSMSVAWKQGLFNELKGSLSQEVADLIDWTENMVAERNDGSIAACDASELIATMMLFDIGSFPADQPPVKYVTGPASAFTEWREHTDKYKFLNVVASKVIELSEEILSNFYVDPATRGLLNLRFNQKPVFSDQRVSPTPFLGYERERKMDTGILKPILGSFRTLLELDEANRTIKWKADPIETWRHAKGDIMARVKDGITNHQSVYEFRRNQLIWTTIALTIDANKHGAVGPTVRY